MGKKDIRYGFGYDFDEEGEPPIVLIAEDLGTGTVCLELYEEPKQLTEEWSREKEDWEPGQMAKAILKFMNSNEYRKADG